MKRVLVAALVTLLLWGCASKPQDDEIESLVREAVLSEGLGGLFSLENYTRTNGFRESDNVYVVDVEYDLVFQKSFIEVVREIRADPTGPQYGIFGSKLILSAIQSNFGQFEAGDKIHKAEKVTLHNTEQGWRVALRE
jgi:hypothetical protein